MLGGPIISGATLSRFFALHVFVVPGTHARVRRPCTSGWCSSWASTSGRCPDAWSTRETYIEEYNELTQKDGMPFVPGAFWKDSSSRRRSSWL